MVPTQDKTFPLSVIETLICLAFMTFWCGVNVAMAKIGVDPWMFVIVNSAVLCLALLIAYFGIEFGEETDPMLELTGQSEDHLQAIRRALFAMSEHTSSIKHLLMTKRDETANETLAAILKLLQKQEDRYQEAQQRLQNLMFRDPQIITVGDDDTTIDPHLLNKDAPAINPDDKAKLLTLPKRPARADKPRRTKSQASKAAATPLPSAAAETE